MGPRINLKDSLLKIYKEDNKIQFTVEIVNNNTFPFLDILLLKECSIINRKARRNKVKLDPVIPNNALAPWAYKLSAFKSYIHKAFKHCSDQYLKKEINYILENTSNHCL